MNNFDLIKYLAEGRLFEEAAGYDYASCDGETIELWSKESLNSYISDMAEDEYEGNKEAAVRYMKSEQMLTKLPNSPYLFIYANDESLDILDASNKEEFVELVNKEFHGELEGDVDAMFAKILSLANDSSISGDSQFQQIVIENGKVVGGNSSNSAQDVDTSSYTVVTTKNIKEGKLHEAMSPQDVVDIADTVAEEFTKESAEEGDFLIYTVGRMEADDMSFELDTDVSAQTPKDLDRRGVGEGWGGIFRIKPSADGYEVRNAEKGGLVAMIDNMGNFRMLSAAESRAEMGLEENKEETKPNKMKKSELKEMIKSAFLGETEFGDALRKRAEEESFDDAFDRIDKEPDTYPGEKTLDPDYVKEAEEDEEVDVEAEETEDVEATDVAVDDTETVDVEASAEISPEVKATQDALTAAIEAAKALGDQKLADQIGNSITFFTRTHVVGQDKVAETVDIFSERILKNAGIKK